MDFAKRQLEKYGWSEGQGLGKNSTGIKTALKPKVKLNTAGIGHDPAQEFTYRWWEDAYNNAASNLNIEKTQDGIKVQTVCEESTEISAVKRAKIKRDKMQYGAFIKRETLAEGVSIAPPLDESTTIEEAESRLPKLPETLSDDQLFQACGGLTAHKAARHGHKLSGKLQRVKEQEEAFLKAYQKNQTRDSGKAGLTHRTRETKALASPEKDLDRESDATDEVSLMLNHDTCTTKKTANIDETTKNKKKKTEKREKNRNTGEDELEETLHSIEPIKKKKKKEIVDPEANKEVSVNANKEESKKKRLTEERHCESETREKKKKKKMV